MTVSNNNRSCRATRRNAHSRVLTHSRQTGHLRQSDLLGHFGPAPPPVTRQSEASSQSGLSSQSAPTLQSAPTPELAPILLSAPTLHSASTPQAASLNLHLSLGFTPANGAHADCRRLTRQASRYLLTEQSEATPTVVPQASTVISRTHPMVVPAPLSFDRSELYIVPEFMIPMAATNGSDESPTIQVADDITNSVATSAQHDPDISSGLLSIFEEMSPKEQMEKGLSIQWAYWQSKKGNKEGDVVRVANGAISDTISRLVTNKLWSNAELRAKLIEMVRKKISNPSVCIGSYPRIVQASTGEGFYACKPCIRAQLPCARFQITKVPRHVMIGGQSTIIHRPQNTVFLASLPGKGLSDHVDLRHLKRPSDKGYYVREGSNAN
ncbi:hypothetical protein E8E13_000245 [Curvularia kusanoi]|uniref:Uncharacterized protein n=1 Tax=Curvularia kusanoi TaxID=90978 RepID=A0A9P4T4C1_CURKU|nr:hypothetical protein E8E13_000245 [Curvularia kusanoi]